MTCLDQNLDETRKCLARDIFVGQTAPKFFEVFVLTGGGSESDLSSLKARKYFIRLAGRADQVAPIAPDPARNIAPLVAKVRVLREKRDSQFLECAIERGSRHYMSSA
jgi:hypothetical protein